MRSAHVITTLDTIVAFGQHDNADSKGHDPYAYILVLDPATGAWRQMETVRHSILEITRQHPIHGDCARVQYCGLCSTGDRLTIVVVFRDGLVYAINLRHFLKDGLPQGCEGMAVAKPLKKKWRVSQADVVGQTIAMSVDVRPVGLSICAM